MTEPTSLPSATDPEARAPEEAADAGRSDRHYQIIGWGLVATLALSCAVAFVLNLVDPSYPEAVANMEREVAKRPNTWVLLYQDGVAQLCGHSDRYDDPKSLHYLPPPYRVASFLH